MKRLLFILALAIIVIVTWAGPAYAHQPPSSLGGIFSTPIVKEKPVAKTIKPFPELVLDLAMKQIGKPYVFGAAGPYSFDCSGLVQWCYNQVTHTSYLPHATIPQWEFWTQHPDLCTCMHNGVEITSAEQLKPGTLIMTQFEGSDGHEMIFAGTSNKNSPAYSPYANPAWNYTYLQAPSSGDVVKLSEFDLMRRDTAQGGARGLRFGRFILAKYPANMTPVSTDTTKKEDDMQSWDYNHVTKVTKIDCYRDKANYWVTTDGATKNLVFTFQAKDGGEPIPSNGQDMLNVQHDHDMQAILAQPKFAGLKGSYKLTISCPDPINISIREIPKG